MADPAQVAASLSQLEGALESYLALGSDTPLGDQAKSWLDDVRQEREMLKSDEPDGDDVNLDQAESEDSSPSDFRSATKAAREHFGQNGTSRRDGGGTKPSDEEQSPDDEGKKKRSKAY